MQPPTPLTKLGSSLRINNGIGSDNRVKCREQGTYAANPSQGIKADRRTNAQQPKPEEKQIQGNNKPSKHTGTTHIALNKHTLQAYNAIFLIEILFETPYYMYYDGHKFIAHEIENQAYSVQYLGMARGTYTLISCEQNRICYNASK